MSSEQWGCIYLKPPRIYFANDVNIMEIICILLSKYSKNCCVDKHLKLWLFSLVVLLCHNKSTKHINENLTNKWVQIKPYWYSIIYRSNQYNTPLLFIHELKHGDVETNPAKNISRWACFSSDWRVTKARKEIKAVHDAYQNEPNESKRTKHKQTNKKKSRRFRKMTIADTGRVGA